MKAMIKTGLLCIFSLMIFGCGQRDSNTNGEPVNPADLILIGNHIVTMDPATLGAKAVAIRGDEIVAVGDRESALALAGKRTRIVELGERALLPGFIDAHGHFSFVARTMDSVNLSSPPVGTVRDIDALLGLLRARLTENPPADGQWLTGYGYDDSLLAEKRHPTRDDLDSVSAEIPIAIVHVSGHLAAVNSAALSATGISAATENPPGGVIRRRAGGREPNGVLEETAASAATFGHVYNSSGDRFIDQARRAVALHASYGVTTVQDGAAMMADVAQLTAAAKKKPFAIDIAAYPYVNRLLKETFDAFQPDADYTGGFRVAGAKFTIDGSPQGRTAWLTEPYVEGPPGVADDYRAYPAADIDLYNRQAADLFARGVPMLVHANGDAAIDAMLDGLEQAIPDDSTRDHRTVIIHAQLMRADQIERAKRLNAVPSFYSAHPFFWGDWHRLSFGDERAQNISPVRWAVNADLPFTIHNDAPIVPPDMMRLIWVAVNRQTREGHILGPHQRATAREALHAVTLGAAYQYFEEDRKGSISVGKQADLVILGKNPLTVDPARLADIPVLETIARGKTIFVSNDELRQ